VKSLFNRRQLELIRHALVTPANPDSADEVDLQLMDEVAPPFDWLCSRYYRLTIEGMDDVPYGPALMVGNHNSGTSFYEAIGMGARWYVERGSSDLVQGLAHDAVVDTPYIGNLMVRLGTVRASHETAAAVFAKGRKITVFPGGNLEAFRPYRDRHKVVFAGRKGFIRLAVRHQVPIVPMVHIGGHETFFILHDGQFIAKALGFDKLIRSDTWPLMFALPWGIALGPLFHLPLPAKCSVRFLEPVRTDNYAVSDAENPDALEEIYNEVTGKMQAALTDMASQRRFPILG